MQEVAALEEVAASAGDDAEMRSLAEEARTRLHFMRHHPLTAISRRAQELAALQERLPGEAEALALMLVPTDEADERDAILEVRAGAGGDEASLFAMDLLRMYGRYAARQPGWRFEILRCVSDASAHSTALSLS